MLALWKRLLITIFVMLAVSYIVGIIWQQLLASALPSYVAGLIGGMAALPTWELLKRVHRAK